MAQYAAEQEALYYGASWKKTAFVSHLDMLEGRNQWPFVLIMNLAATILRAGRKSARLSFHHSRRSIKHPDLNYPSVPPNIRTYCAQATPMGPASFV